MRHNPFITLIAAATLSAFGCSQDDSVLPSDELVEVIATAELPASAQNYVESNYAGYEISAAYKITTATAVNYEAELDSEMNLRFSSDGSFLGKRSPRHLGHHGHGDRPAGEEIALEDAPESVQTYISENYADAELEKVMKLTLHDTTVVFAVHLRGIGHLIFNEAGDFLELKEGGPGHHGPRPELTEIDVDALPDTITTYITEFYDQSIEKAFTVVLPDSSLNYVVRLVDGPDVIFDATGGFVAEHQQGGHHGPGSGFTEIEAAVLPEAILSYVAANYPAATIDKAGYVTTGNGDVHYIVKLNSGEHLHFDEAGTLLDN